MKEIKHEIKIKGNAETVYQALTTKSGLESWHSAHIEGEFKLNDQFTITHEEHASFIWKIIGMEPNRSVKWECIVGPGTAPGTQVQFNIKASNDERVIVECVHTGWTETGDNFTKCNTLWGILLFHLKKFVETGKVDTTFA